MIKKQGLGPVWKDWTAHLSKIRTKRLLPVSRMFAGWPIFLKQR